MTTALEKVLSLASPAVQKDREDPAGDLVLAAVTTLDELSVLLASGPPDDEDDSGSGGSSPGAGGTGAHSDHPLYKKLKQRGVDDATAAKMCARADSRVKATALCEAARVALAGLAAPGGDWVEATALDARSVLALASGSKAPYGNVEYADPGHQADGKKRYPVDTPEHTRAAWSYINQKDNASKYKSGHLAAIKAKIRSAAKKHGIDISDDSSGEKVAATMVALAARREEAVQAMHHGPFTGKHSHGHLHQVVSSEEHFHNNDNDHSRHMPDVSPGGW